MKYKKSFFKQFNDQIDISKNTYSTYWSRNDERVWQKTINDRIFNFNNRNVVFNNFYLSRMFDVYINVEMCSMISMIKYIYKYVYKNGNHTTTIIWKNFNEIEHYYVGQYLNFLKTVWRIFEFHIYEEFSVVNVFSIHLKNEQIVYFSSNTFSQKLKKRKENIWIKLMIYFKYFFLFLFIYSLLVWSLTLWQDKYI